VDKQIATYGEHHQSTLTKLAESIKAAALNEQEVFSTQAEVEIQNYIETNRERLPAILQDFYEAYQETEASRTSGHEHSHILENISSAARIARSYTQANNPLSEAELFEITLACLGHDLGRYAEPTLKDMRKQDVGVLLPLMMGRGLAQTYQFPPALGNRVLYDIGTGFVRETQHRGADIVHQADREQLLGTTMWPRTFILGLGEGEYDYAWPSLEEVAESAHDLRNPYNANTPVASLPQRMEFWARNVYPPVSPDGTKVLDAGKQETATLLMLALRNQPETMYRAVFAPEVKAVPQQELGGFKKPLPSPVYEAALEAYETFLSHTDMAEYSLENLRGLIFKVAEIEKIEQLPEFKDHLTIQLANHSELENQNLWLMFRYVLETRHVSRVQQLEELQEDGGGVLGTMEKWVREELEGRERVYERTRDLS
jgi:hypothetical protein